MSVSFNLSVTVISRVALGIIGLFVIGLLTRSLGPSGYGFYSFVFAYLYIFSTIADLGLNTILVREISQKEDKEKDIASSIFSIRLAVVLACIFLADLIVLFLPYPTYVKEGVFVGSIFVVLSSLSQVLIGIFQKYLKIYYVSVADILSRIVQLGLVFWASRFSTGIISFIWIVVFSEVIHFVLIFIFARSLIRIRFLYDKIYWKETIKSALPIAVSLVFILIYFRMDTIILSLMKPAEDVGIYAVGYKLLEALIFLPAAYVGLIMAKLSKAVSDRESFKNLFRGAFDNLAIFSLPLAGFLIVSSRQVVNIIGGSGFEAAEPVLQILALAIIFIFFGTLGGNTIVALNIQKRGAWIYFGGALINIIANLIFIPRYSYIAASWTTVITEMIVTIGMFVLIFSEIKVFPSFIKLAKSFIATILMMTIIAWFKLPFIGAAVLSMSYFAFLYVLKGFKKSDFLEAIGRAS